MNLQLDRRLFIASLGGAAAVSLMTDEAKADAMEDAGCTDTAIFDHCRGTGPHVRGCWVVDLILSKS